MLETRKSRPSIVYPGCAGELRWTAEHEVKIGRHYLQQLRQERVKSECSSERATANLGENQ